MYPALDVTWSAPPAEDAVDRLLAEIDDEGPTAVEERPSGLRVFFATAAARERAAARLGQGVPIDVPDENWAERSQAALGPVVVGDIVVAPPWHSPKPTPGRFQITIQPSMGFGTGHHASTRLCLGLLQRVPVEDRRVIDIGTGSGVLAIAAWRLGAATVVGIDYDADAIESARENLQLNDAEAGITLVIADVDSLTTRARAAATGPAHKSFDLALANLTGAVLTREASAIATWLAPGAHLILSGIQTDEERGVADAFRALGFSAGDRGEEDGWIALRLTSPTASTAR